MKNNLNPPFSLFREYVKQLIDYGKKFIIIGNINVLGWKETFSYVKEDKMWTGYNPISNFNLRNGGIGKVGCRWYTNIETEKRRIPLDLYKRYSNEYPRYNCYDAIDVAKVSEIPMDYNGIMGVPLSFIDNYCPAQFEIIAVNNDTEELKKLGVKPLGKETIELMHRNGNHSHLTANMVQLYYIENGTFKRPFARILIRKRNA